MRLVWAQYALDDRETIFSYIESADPRAAVHVDRKSFALHAVFSTFPRAVDPAELPEPGSLLSRVALHCSLRRHGR